MFEIKKFNSGEWNVKLIERIHGNEAVIHCNWFDESQRDVMLLLMKIGAIKKQYGMIPIVVNAPYLPYSRQDRIFEVGQDIPIETLVKAITGRYSDIFIKTMGLHCGNYFKNVFNKKIDIDFQQFTGSGSKIVFPDINAEYHFESNYTTGNFYNYANSFIYLNKQRDNTGIKLTIQDNSQKYIGGKYAHYLICDDICDGGRTFVEAAKLLKAQGSDDITIELMIYHAFMTHGLDDLKAAGISKIKIINPDSYEYVINKFPENKNYFELITI